MLKDSVKSKVGIREGVESAYFLESLHLTTSLSVLGLLLVLLLKLLLLLELQHLISVLLLRNLVQGLTHRVELLKGRL